ncbi:MAG: carbohydrate kinase family protein, partial [bacterium]|nr:carbohydrate kinase family protein [bacterium]
SFTALLHNSLNNGRLRRGIITAYLSSHPKIKLAWNPGSTQIKAGRGKLSRLLSKTEILILNRDEAIELAGTSAKNSNPRSLVKTLRSWGPKVVVITNGKKGVYAYAGEKVVFHQALVGKQTDTTGAGDAFGSTFVAGYIRSRGELALPLREAAVNSSSVVRQVGAQAGLLRRKALTEEIHKQYPHA